LVPPLRYLLCPNVVHIPCKYRHWRLDRANLILIDEPMLIFDEPRQIQPQDNFSYDSPRPLTTISMPRSIASERKRHSISRRGTFNLSARPWTSYSTKKARPRISAPMDFRRVSDPIDFEHGGPTGRRGRFRPLELSIYLPDGRLSPLPDFSTFDWDDKPSNLALPKPAMVRDSTVSEPELPQPPNFSRPSSSNARLSAQDSPGLILQPDRFGSALPGLSVEESTGYTHRDDYMITLPKQPTTTNPRPSSSRTRTPEPISRTHSRSISDLVRPLKPSSTGSFKRSTNDLAIDDAIRELNTIVEERRTTTKTVRPNPSPPPQSGLPSTPPSPHHHVPAIAPSMKVRARSETLSDIGSAFSVPLSSATIKPPAVYSTTSSVQQQPLASPPAKSTRSSRLRTWFSWSSAKDEYAPDSPTAGGIPGVMYMHHESSGSTSTFSSASSMDDDSSTITPTVVTGVVTPMSSLRSPTRDGYAEGSPKLDMDGRPRASTSTSASGASYRAMISGGGRLNSNRSFRRKRGESIDTTRTISTVDSTILMGPEYVQMNEKEIGLQSQSKKLQKGYRGLGNPLGFHPVHPVGVAI
jgi:hypothetical protein